MLNDGLNQGRPSFLNTSSYILPAILSYSPHLDRPLIAFVYSKQEAFCFFLLPIHLRTTDHPFTQLGNFMAAALP